MEPPKPTLSAPGPAAAPTATPEEVMEYEKLLVQRFETDPDLPKDPAAAADVEDRERRIRELGAKIHGTIPQR
jgi:hypothetical protein